MIFFLQLRQRKGAKKLFVTKKMQKITTQYLKKLKKKMRVFHTMTVRCTTLTFDHDLYFGDISLFILEGPEFWGGGLPLQNKFDSP